MSSLISKLLFPLGRHSASRLARDLQGKTILITGASFGIGEALSRLLAAETEATLLLVARTKSKLETLQLELSRGRKGAIIIFSCDLSKKSQRQLLLKKLQAYRIDILVSNAGKSIRRSIFKSLDRLHDFERTMELNYMAAVELSLALIPQLLENKGQIINISAVNVHFPPAAGWAAYQASKVAFDQWLRACEPELAPEGLVCTAIYLPLVRTRMIAPTSSYQHWPAMQPASAARWICRAIVKRPRSLRPWWMPPAAFFSRLGSGLWRIATRRLLRS